jgi:hypothetical protein
MKQVWKCEFCNTFSHEKEVIKQHEHVCQFNPKLKRCGSCANLSMEHEIFVCAAKVDPVTMDAVEDGVVQCDKWVIG